MRKPHFKVKVSGSKNDVINFSILFEEVIQNLKPIRSSEILFDSESKNYRRLFYVESFTNECITRDKNGNLVRGFLNKIFG